MDSIPSFSQRHGLSTPEPEITVRHEAPDWLRDFVIRLAYDVGAKPSVLRAYLCDMLLESPNAGNWSEYPNIDGEVQMLLAGTEWFQVYDFIEAIADRLPFGRFNPLNFGENPELTQFTEKLNAAFRKKGVGWQLVNRRIQIRGAESFETAVRQSREGLVATGRNVASHEIDQALADLSRRPNPDVTGAIQHGMAALECLARDVSGDTKLTLGELLKKHPNLFPPPLDQGISKIWGYASDKGRHLREGQPPHEHEAQLIVGLASVLTSYLLKKEMDVKA
ncbi:MAG TPA: hypothetical protein VHY22_04605 [Chthoniobacteraceae bacterium]|jgi:hypothetical protein|nr:hypothetical protein [Chthoniobacteraceae bacterium]